jgi:hypothetical protein
VDRAEADRIAEALRDALAALAADRWPERAPDRRALAAELEELVEPVLAGLAALGAAAVAVREADDERRVAAWRAWSVALARVFACADQCWAAALPALAESEGRRGRLWRRVLRGAVGRNGGAAGALAWLVALAGSVAVALVLGAPGRAIAQGAPPARPPAGGEALVIVRVEGGSDSLDARALARLGFDVVGGRAGERLVVVDSAERARLERLGVRTTVLRAPRAPGAARRPGDPPDAPAAPPARQPDAAQSGVYRSFDDPRRGVRVWLDSVVQASAGRARLDTLGRSVEGRPILAVKLGGAGDDPARPNVLFLATYHAREWAATEMALRLVRHLALTPAPGARLDSLLRRRDVWVVPVVNPDGYEHSHTTTRLWRKNRRPLGVVAGGVAFGVDLNRNHAVRWGLDDFGSSPNPRSEVYRGPAAASEPETQAIERLHERHPPVVALSYHTYAGQLLHPPGGGRGSSPGTRACSRRSAGTEERPAVRDRLPARPSPLPAPHALVAALPDQRRVHRLRVRALRHARLHPRAHERLRGRDVLRLRVPRRRGAAPDAVRGQPALRARRDRERGRSAGLGVADDRPRDAAHRARGGEPARAAARPGRGGAVDHRGRRRRAAPPGRRREPPGTLAAARARRRLRERRARPAGRHHRGGGRRQRALSRSRHRGRGG